MKFQPNLNRTFQFYQFEIINKSIREKLILLIKSLILLAIKPYKVLNNDVETEFLFFTSTYRKDHLNFFHDIYSFCDYDKEILMVDSEYKININFGEPLKYCHKSISKMTNKLSFIDKMIIITRATRLFSVFSNLEAMKCKHLIVYSEAQPVEDILVQYFKNQFIKTISLQHGLFVDYKTIPNINMLNYHDVKTDIVLAWGRTSQELFTKYNPKLRTEVCGKPIELNKIKIQKDPSLIGVVFDQPMFREYNKKMLQIAYEVALINNMKVVSRLHPADDHKYYEYDQALTEFGCDANNAYYILAHTTTMIYEYLALGYKVYKFRSDVPANVINEELKFSSAEELEKKFEMSFDFQQESLRHIRYAGDESKMKYKEFFDNVHENQRGINNQFGTRN